MNRGSKTARDVRMAQDIVDVDLLASVGADELGGADHGFVVGGQHIGRCARDDPMRLNV